MWLNAEQPACVGSKRVGSTAATKRRPLGRVGDFLRLLGNRPFGGSEGTQRRRVPDHLIAGGQVGCLDELLTGTFRVSTGKEGQTEVVVRFRRTRREADRLLRIGTDLLVVSGPVRPRSLVCQLQ